MNVTLSGSTVFANVTKLKWGHLKLNWGEVKMRVQANPTTIVLIRRGSLDWEKHRKENCEDGDRV